MKLECHSRNNIKRNFIYFGNKDIIPLLALIALIYSINIGKICVFFRKKTIAEDVIHLCFEIYLFFVHILNLLHENETKDHMLML